MNQDQTKPEVPRKHRKPWSPPPPEEQDRRLRAWLDGFFTPAKMAKLARVYAEVLRREREQREASGQRTRRGVDP
jgi:hypothetical protein